MRLSSIASLVAVSFVYLHTQPVMAASLFFIGNGAGTVCSQTAPCELSTAISQATATPVELSCADSSDVFSGATINKSLTIDCAGTAGSINGIEVNSGAVVTLRNLTIGGNTEDGIFLINGTLILENVHFVGVGSIGINAAPISPSTLIVKNSIINRGGVPAVLLKPGVGGSLSASFDHVTIAGNGGGGIRLDTTNGPVTADVTDSVISNNAGNGVSAQGGAGGAAMLSIHNSVIADNGAAGVNATGTNGAALVDTTLLDSNGSATSVASGGRIVTYGNNRIVGTLGSGFTGTASLQ
jgi:hypothetical protein